MVGFDSIVDAVSALYVLGSLIVAGILMRIRGDQLRLLWELSLPLGLIGFLVGVVSMLAAASDPAQIAPALAIAVLTVVYASAIRLLLTDTRFLPLDFSLPVTAKVLGSAVFLIAISWAMNRVSQGDIAIYWHAQAAFLLSGVALLVFLINRALGQNYATGWSAKLLAIGWLGFSIGVVEGLTHLDNPMLLGPAIAFGFLSLLYALVAIVLGLVWSPSQMTERDGSLSLGLAPAGSIVASVMVVLGALVIVLP